MSKFYFPKFYLLLLSLLLAGAFTTASAYDLVVAKDGSGNYTTVQAAINAVPANLTSAYTIFIKNGKYKEKITVPSNKPFIQLIGESVANVVLTYDDASGTPAAGGGTLGTQNSASVSINATDFTAINITFENSYGEGPAGGQNQAVAVLVNNDRVVFKNCRFLGNQDTLYIKGSGTPRHYFSNCYIDGTIDFIFGSSVAIFDSCTVFAKSRTTAGTSYITAANTPPGQTYGYAFKNCKLPQNTGTTAYFLGRPWQNSTGSLPLTENKVVFIKPVLSSSIRPEGWSTWDAGTNTALITYGEYSGKFFNATPVDVSQRVSWSKQLTAGESGSYTNANMFGSWDPFAANSVIALPFVPQAAITNFKAIKGNPLSTFSFNIAWPINQIKFELYRSADNIAFTKINETIAPDDTTYNFQLTDAVPPAGSIYSYYLKASKAGYVTNNSDTLFISSAPTITTTSLNLGNFSQSLGTPSPSQSYSVSGTDLTGNVNITPPVNFEVSANGGTTWFSNTMPLVLTPMAGVLAATTINVRLNAAALGGYAGNIVHSTTGTGATLVSVAGNTTNAPAVTFINLQQWPLNISNDDSAAVRYQGVIAATPVLNKLYLSNGSAVPAVPAYSSTQGQAFGAGSTGDGTWGTAAPTNGPGGNLNRTFYEQFKVTAAPGFTLRIDSLILNASFYNTPTNTKMAVVYSKDNFVNDSIEVNSGVGADGNALTNGGVSGNFNYTMTLPNQTAGTLANFRLALGGNNGDTLTPGQAYTFRLYFACGSSSAGRYAKLKNVMVKGVDLSSTPLPLKLLSFKANDKGNDVEVQWSVTQVNGVKQFVVERSNDGRTFTAVKTIAARSAAGLQTYNIKDVSLNAGKYYYRLKLVDAGGGFGYSPVVQIFISPKSGVILLSNPVKETLWIKHPAALPGASFMVITADGKRVASATAEIAASYTSINLSSLQKGIYFVVFQNSEKGVPKRFIKD